MLARCLIPPKWDKIGIIQWVITHQKNRCHARKTRSFSTNAPCHGGALGGVFIVRYAQYEPSPRPRNHPKRNHMWLQENSPAATRILPCYGCKCKGKKISKNWTRWGTNDLRRAFNRESKGESSSINEPAWSQHESHKFQATFHHNHVRKCEKICYTSKNCQNHQQLKDQHICQYSFAYRLLLRCLDDEASLLRLEFAICCDAAIGVDLSKYPAVLRV